MRDNEYNSETEKNRFEECHLGQDQKRGHLTQDVKVANEIVWDKEFSPFM
jgi:hypothetical protein